MRVALFHNSSSGSEDHTDVELTRAIERAGHEVAHVVTRLADLTAALQTVPCDLVVVAGGDGTVSRTTCELAGWEVPFSIFPLGTANNTARALGLLERPRKIAKSWHAAAPVPFDLGLLDDGAVRQRFSEAVGWGVFAQTIAAAKEEAAPSSVQRTLKRDRKLFREAAACAEPRFYRVEVDGRDYSGSYVLVEVMNLPFLGPRLQLSPRSELGDGLLEVVLARASDRDALRGLAKTGFLQEEPLPNVKGSHVRIEASDGLLHRDGRLFRHPPGPRLFEINVEARAAHHLRPVTRA
jgi:diacylglycerol kinase family enzyme